MFLFNRPSTLLIPLAILAVTTCPIPGARAGLIFDNTDPQVSFTTVPGLGTRVAVANDITIGDIAVKTDSSAIVLYKFAIFDTANTSAPVYLSGPKSFAGDAFGTFTYKMSDDFSFTLLGGHTYYIGAITSTGATFALDKTPESQNGITSSSYSVELVNYNGTPQVGDSFSYEGQIQLFAPSTAAVPEPSSMILIASAIPLGLAWMGMRRRRIAMPA